MVIRANANEGQRSVSSDDRVEKSGRTDEQTNGQMDGVDCITSLTNVVGNDHAVTARVQISVWSEVQMTCIWSS